MNKLQNIIAGYRNLLIKDPAVEEFALERLEICRICPLATESKIITFVAGKQEDPVDGAICGSCGCPLAAKTRSPEEHCPEGKWEAQETKQPEHEHQ